MKVKIDDIDLYEFIETGTSKKLKKYKSNKGFNNGLTRALDMMSSINEVNELSNFSFLHFEALRNQYSGFYSVRVQNGKPERIIFKQEEEGDEQVLIIVITELDTDHYGNKK